MYRNLESTERPLMPTKVLITYRHFLVFARHTYLRLKKKFRVIGNGGILRRTLNKYSIRSYEFVDNAVFTIKRYDGYI